MYPGVPRANKIKQLFVATYQGQCTSVDPFQSNQVGFIARRKGKLTTQWYQYGTVFVDHFFILPIFCSNTEGKTRMQTVCKQARHQNMPFHSDNGHFVGNAFQQHDKQHQQTLTFYTGLISPHFHYWYDAFFKVIIFNKPETMMSSNWQILAGLERPDKTPTVEQVLQGTRLLQPARCNANL
ncbi:hypothetical protein ACHAW6_001349 [Cyclotella cf. meneghiniana]